MIFNYLKLSLRLLTRNPFFTLINVVGLSAGFAIFFILWPYASTELDSNRFYKDADRIYRLRVQFNFSDESGLNEYFCGTYQPVFAPVLASRLPAIESYCRIVNQENFNYFGQATTVANTYLTVVINEEKRTLVEEHLAYADPNVFDFFGIALTKGDPDKALSIVNTIVLSETSAVKYFGNADPIGRTLILNDSISLMVTGVFKDHPKNSHFTFDMVISALNIHGEFERTTPFYRSAHCYFKVRPDASLPELERSVNFEADERYGEMFDINFPGSKLMLFLQPLQDVPFAVFDNDPFTPKSRYILHLFRFIAVGVLLMAWINYLNLSLSAHAKRLKEFATRKTNGARTTDFLIQFLVEAILLNAIALLCTLTFIQFTEEPLQQFFHFYMPGWMSIPTGSIILQAAIIVTGTILTGLYPTWRLLKWSPSQLNLRSPRTLRLPLRTILTGIQYLCAFTLFAFLYSLNRQIGFLLKHELGINRNDVIVIDLPGQEDLATEKRLQTFKQELLRIDRVLDCTISSNVVGDKIDNIVSLHRIAAPIGANVNSDGGVDERFIPFYDIKLLAGRNFSFDDPANRKEIIISKLAAEKIGIDPDLAVGTEIMVTRVAWSNDNVPCTIIGLIDDYEHKPLFVESGLSNANQGYALTYGSTLIRQNKPNKISLRIEPEGISKTISAMEEVFERIFHGQVFHWYFLDDHINRHYDSERIARNQLVLFTIVAICISCLGLLGMLANKVVEKTKEIGVRKVLGARMVELGAMLLSGSAKQVCFATIAGVPIALYLTREYLTRFSQQVPIQWWHFAVPVAILVLIMFSTVATVLWKVGLTNPVEALKHE